MTLRQQLLLAIFIVFLAVFAGMQTLSVHATRDFLQQQLSSSAQEAATSLSRTLEPALSKEDLVLAELQVSTMFDRGYYQKIVVLSPHGDVLVQKDLPLDVQKVPKWFASILPLDTPPGESFVTSGWRQAGKVVVVSQPTLAYEFLWRSVKEVTWWLLAMYLLAITFMVLLLRVILNPLLQIEMVALDIQEKRFNQIEVLPRARELRRVVVAMNEMSLRIGDMLDVEIERAEAFRKEAYLDKVTGLDNRQGFDLRFNTMLDESGSFSSAAIIVLELDGLKEFNTEFGYKDGDAVLMNVGQILRDVVGVYTRVASRIGGTSLAVIGADVTEDKLQMLIKEIQLKVSSYFAYGPAAKRLSFSVGAALFSPSQSRSEIFARLDLAVETARQEGHNRVSVVNLEAGAIHSSGSFAWRTLIMNALEENRWALFVQPVVGLQSHSTLHHEIFSRLIDTQGELIPAGQFMPMALRHRLMEDVDRAIITLILEMLESATNRFKDVAVNVSIQAIENPEFCEWLFARLKLSKSVAHHLSVELSEFGCAKDLELTHAFVQSIRGLGLRFGIDHFGLDPRSLNLLRQVPPDYIKLDGGLVKESVISESSRAHLRSIVAVAKSLEIPVIAQSVEGEELVAALASDGVDGGQGYHFGAPAQV